MGSHTDNYDSDQIVFLIEMGSRTDQGTMTQWSDCVLGLFV